MSENKKPRLCEVLGVEVNEEFRVMLKSGIRFSLSDKFRINERGVREYYDKSSEIWREAFSEECLTDLINHPEKIIRPLELTPDEQAVLRQLKGMGYTKIEIGKDVIGETAYLCKGNDITNVDLLIRDMLPSLKLGQSVDLTEIE